jgi:hypothetical protein
VKRWWQRRNRRGQALVEFALVAPLMVFLVMAALQVAMVSMIHITLQGLAQDTARYMAISSAASPNYPRPRWADGDDGISYCNTSMPSLLQAARFTQWEWTPACAAGVDCISTGVRRADNMLRLTITYDWSHLMIMPVGIGGMFGWSFPTTTTVNAAEVMQY